MLIVLWWGSSDDTVLIQYHGGVTVLCGYVTCVSYHCSIDDTVLVSLTGTIFVDIRTEALYRILTDNNVRVKILPTVHVSDTQLAYTVI